MSKTSTTIHYVVKPISPEQHLYSVSLTIDKPDPDGQQLFMPAWIPGSYLIRDFARNIVQIKASSNGQRLSLQKTDKHTWQCEACTGSVCIEYEVYAWDLSVRGAHLDITHAYFNGTCLFLAVANQQDLPCSIKLLKPQGERYENWRVATTLPRDTAELYGFGAYHAKDYDELIDHPVEMGEFSLGTFEAGGIPHDIVLTGKHLADMQRLCDDLKKICETHIQMFGELPVTDRYMFLTMVVGDGYGGLEHRSSTSLLCSRKDLPLKHQQKATDGYINFLGLCSHEYFHTWNVKRIKPAVFMPYDLTQEAYTKQLWAFEGFTSYYDDLALVRSGVIDLETYLKLVGQIVTRVFRHTGRLKQSVVDSSFDAWTRFYKQDENAPNAIVSYYTKGALIALGLDLLIRKHTQNKKSLDNVMRKLWNEYGAKNIGVPEGEIEKIACDISAYDLTAFFNGCLHGTEDIPLANLLQEVGIHFKQRPAESNTDKGGTPPGNANKTPLPYFGANIGSENGGVRLLNVFEGSPAQIAGLSAGDICIAINDIKVDMNNFDQILSGYQQSDNIKVHAFRRDELMVFNVTLQAQPLSSYYMEINKEASEQQKQTRQHWIKAAATD